MTLTASGGLPPATAYHRWPMRLLNRLLRVANTCGLALVSLDAEEMMEAARRETGLSDFGDPRFLDQYQLLCRCLNSEADLNPLGRTLTRISILRILRHRLWAEALVANHPEILEREIRAPAVVVGLARSGTTRLHRLLAADPGFLHLKSWETVNPVPWPDSYGADIDPRITSIEKGLKAVLYMSPQMATVHPLGAHEVEEEVGLIQHAFASQLFEVMTYVPTFAEHLMRHDQTFAYEYMVRLMKIVSWWRKDDERPWILKTPQHMQDLDALLKVFPDARLICSHRDPIKAVGSACSMTWNSMVRDTDHVDPHWVGREWLGKTDAMLRKTLEVRAGVPAAQQTDVLYADINRDWRAVVEGIYRFLERPLTDVALANMQAWLDGNAQHKHGAHHYRLEDFGLTEKAVDDKLMYYRERFGIPYEGVKPA